MNKWLVLMLPVLTLAFTSSVRAQDKNVNQQIEYNLGDHTKYEAFFHAFQKAVAAHDANAVAALVHYPIGVKVNGKETNIKTPKAFAQYYDGIMSPGITKAVTGQQYDDLFVNYQGIMFGNGQVWINGICQDKECKKFDVKVVTIQESS